MNFRSTLEKNLTRAHNTAAKMHYLAGLDNVHWRICHDPGSTDIDAVALVSEDKGRTIVENLVGDRLLKRKDILAQNIPSDNPFANYVVKFQVRKVDRDQLDSVMLSSLRMRPAA